MKRISVLLADDNPTFLRIAALFLEQQPDLDVVCKAGGGKEAVAQSVSLRPAVAVIDLNMPDLHGLEAIPQIRARAPETGVVALTHEFVSKNTMHTDLVPTIRRVAGSRKAKVSGERSEVRGQKSEVRGQWSVVSWSVVP